MEGKMSDTQTVYDPNQGTTPKGVKHDTGKLPYELLPWDAVEEVVKVLQFGAQKYAARNWEKGMSWSRIFGAIQRHGVAMFQRGENKDPETQLLHTAHLACEALFLLAYQLRKVGTDDRPFKIDLDDFR
jgi:hypothetical protein